MQGLSGAKSWVPPSGVLGDLIRYSLVRAQAAASELGELRARAADQKASVPLAQALRQPTVAVIAEIKRASPSRGDIAPGIDAADRAACYVNGGAAAISVLTEPSRFGGSLQDLAEVVGRVDVPVIRKDFIVSPIQLWEARAAGASAALLIVRALIPDELARLVDCAAEAGLSVLVEVRSEEELALALGVGATVIGVNNRNLETLVIEPETAPRLIRTIPASCIAVAESGIHCAADVAPAAEAGADAILVGSAISTAGFPSDAVSALSGVRRRMR